LSVQQLTSYIILNKRIRGFKWSSLKYLPIKAKKYIKTEENDKKDKAQNKKILQKANRASQLVWLFFSPPFFKIDLFLSPNLFFKFGRFPSFNHFG